MIQRKCETCMAEFPAWPYEARTGRARFCSRKCAGRAVADRLHDAALTRRPAVKQPLRHRLLVAADGRTITVDIQDYDWASRYAWHVDSGGYAVRSRVKGRPSQLHRAIVSRALGQPLAKSETVDHINRDRLDCRRENLRLCSPSQNSNNIGISQRNRSGYKGVNWDTHTGKWKATIGVRSQSITIGRFTTPLEAAYVRDQFAIQLAGEFAWLNVL